MWVSALKALSGLSALCGFGLTLSAIWDHNPIAGSEEKFHKWSRALQACCGILGIIVFVVVLLFMAHENLL